MAIDLFYLLFADFVVWSSSKTVSKLLSSGRGCAGLLCSAVSAADAALFWLNRASAGSTDLSLGRGMKL